MHKPNIAILGVRGIGKVHARIFNALGANVDCVLASNEGSAISACVDLEKSYGIITKGYTSINDVLERHPDAVSICTPPSLHFEQILKCFEKGVPVFCEKPLYWDQGLSLREIENKINLLENHKNRKLIVNTSNTIFIDAITDYFGEQKDYQKFTFQFYTQGKYEGKDIALDLMPHGFSVLLRILGKHQIDGFSFNVNQNHFQCTFNYAGKVVEFDFREDPDGPKYLSFYFDDKHFQRVQEGNGKTYRVYIENTNINKKVEVDDPFTVYIKNFIQKYITGEKGFDDASGSFINIRLMLECMKKINQSI